MKLLPLIASIGALAAVAAAPVVGAKAGDPLDSFRLLGPKLSAEQLGQNGLGFFSGLGALLKALPPGNTASVQVGDNPPITAQGPGPQAVSLSTGNVTANAAAGPTGASASVSMSNPTNSMTVNTSAGFGSAGASIQSGT